MKFVIDMNLSPLWVKVFENEGWEASHLAATQAKSPSVIQVRTQDVTPESLQDLLVTAVRQHEAILKTGALIIVDEYKLRARILPIRR